MSDETNAPRANAPVEQALIDAFIALARGDFSVRLPRNFRRDTSDTLAFFVNLIAEELSRLLAERERGHRELAESVEKLSECFLALAAGNFDARAERTHTGDPIDVLAFLFNNTASEVGDAFVELDQQRATLEAILESMIDGVLLLDSEAKVRRVNRALLRLLDREDEDVVGQPLAVLLAPSERELAASIVDKVTAGSFRDRDTLFSAGNGEARSMALNASAQLGPSGELLGVVLVARDDRELKQAQAQLSLADRLTTIGTLAAGVAHEVNNPLAFVIGNLDFVVEELEEVRDGGEISADTAAELLRALEASQGGAERVRKIVRDLKAFARPDNDTVSTIDLNQLIDYAANMIRNEVRHHARVIKDYGDVPRVIASEGRLVQVFLNLIQNAAQAIPPGNAADNHIRIRTGVAPQGGEALVEIEDSGVGITPEQRVRIFDAFYTTKPTGVGTGIGLAICQKIISGLGGRIEVESEVGKGTTFRVFLPALDMRRRKAAAAAASAGVERAGEEGAAPRRAQILVVDDEVEIGEAVARMLGRSYDVDVVHSGAAALERLETQAYDLVLSDLLMPEMTGMQLFEHICAKLPDLRQRVVFMTGGSFSPEAQQFLASVDNPRMEKPIKTRALREAIRAWLAAAG